MNTPVAHLGLAQAVRMSLLLAAATSLTATAAPNPGSDRLTEADPEITYSGGPLAITTNSSSCTGQPGTEIFNLKVDLPPDFDTRRPDDKVQIVLGASDTADLVLTLADAAGNEITSSDTGFVATPEQIIVDAQAGEIDYQVKVCVFAGGTDSYSVTITLTDFVPPPPPPPPPADRPRYDNFYPAQGVATFAGEPSVGCNWLSEQVFSNTNVDGSTNDIPNGGRVNYFGGFMSFMLRATFNDCASPAYVTWDEMPLTLAATPRALGDPIMFTDPVTGRSWVIQLEPGAGATIDYTDDDGDDGFNPSTGPFLSANDFDHETIGSGPYHLPLTGAEFPLSKGRAVYYAVQGITEAVSFRSDDHGVTFNAKVPMYTLVDCSGLHGHVKVSPKDGTVYVPPRTCGGFAGLAVSEDNGLGWTIRRVNHPTATVGANDDPSLGIATDGTLYLGFTGENGHPRISVSHDRGKTWTVPYDVGAQVTNGGPVLNIAFPEVVAGDPDRAAFAFFGSETGGGIGASSSPGFPGVWYLYISTTFDGGQSWITTRATPPDDPIQRHGICGGGNCRNLLDFFDAQVDKEGRVLIAGEDGCTSLNCIQDINYSGPDANDAQAFITRTSGGKRLFAQYDPVEPAVPGAPQLSGGLNATRTAANLSWKIPDNGGSPIVVYNVYHRVGTTDPFTKIATVPVTTYTDATYDDSLQNFYHVTAVNAVGEGPYCLDFSPSFVILPNPCELPGILALDDLAQDGTDEDSGQNIPPDPALNVRQLFVSELKEATSADQLTFTLQVAPSTTPVPPNSEWFIIWNRKTVAADGSDRFYVAMRTDGAGAPSFEYGNFGPPLPIGGVPPPNANTPTKLGDADSGSYDPAAGIIRIILLNSRAENLAANDALGGLNVRTFAGRSGAPGQRSQNNASDITPDGSYTLTGGAACGVNLPPTALLIAYPDSGTAPLTVTFDVSASSEPDDGDYIKNYYVQFGDEYGAVLTGPPLTVTHEYLAPGVYTATLTVEDSHGASSVPSPATEFVVTVLDPNAPASQTLDNTRLAGALPLLSMLALLGLLALRGRRR